ncbi:MAG TPA: hypothetical protein VKD22_11925 [Ramlibacter sp.]|nr:hypothetical protein [Ramlibacter sp.]
MVKPGRVAIALTMWAAAQAHASGSWLNVTSGAPLRPGVYGRIQVRGALPPLISPRPVVARQTLGPVQGDPLYFYLPAGQVRKWALFCRRYDACERPVYFVRMDSPGKLGRWNARERALNRHGTALLSPDAGGHF